VPVAPVQLPAAVFNVVEPTVPVPAPEPTVEPQQPVAVIQEQQQLFVVQEPQFVVEPQQQFVAQPTQFVAQPTQFAPTPVVAAATPVLPSPTPVTVVVEERQQAAETNRFFAQPTQFVAQPQQVVAVQRPVFTVPNTIARARTGKQSGAAAPAVRPNVGIVRSAYNAPGTPGFERAYSYSFEAENGIKQEATGELRTVGDAEVMIMSGSYEYTGGDGELYRTNWYADETGYHAEAEHLPRNVPIPFPEIQEAVDAQLRFAAENPDYEYES